MPAELIERQIQLSHPCAGIFLQPKSCS